MTFQLPTNIPLGTYMTDGVRTGPTWDSITGTAPDTNGHLLVGYYDRYGKGVLTSPICTYNIVPYADTPFVNPVPAVVPAAGWLTLANGATGAAQIQTATSINMFPQGAPNATYVQFDWPRVPQITIAGGPILAPIQVTIFGFDWYGFPLQHTYTVQANGLYPRAITQTDIAFNYKAFYGITGVYANGGTGAATLQISTSPFFGLPYVCKGWESIEGWVWNESDMRNPGGNITLVAGTASLDVPIVRVPGIAAELKDMVVARAGLGATGAGAIGIISVNGQQLPTTGAAGSYTISALAPANQAVVANDLSICSWFLPDGGALAFKAADTTPVATATTGDVRGIIQLPSAADGDWQATPDGATRNVLTFYSMGSDQWLNQLAAGGQPQGAGTVAPLTKSDLYGVDQYYTGVHP